MAIEPLSVFKCLFPLKEKLNEEGKIRLIRLGSTVNANEIAVVFVDDYKEVIRKLYTSKVVGVNSIN